MARLIVAVTIEKVQTFLFEVLQAHIQEHQSNSGTLQQIIQSSNFISRQLYEDIGLQPSVEAGAIEVSLTETGVFSDSEVENVLLKCSGMCVFATTLQPSEVERRLDKLFAKYYLQFKGQLLLKYVCFEQSLNNDQDKLEAIFESKKYLKQSKCLNDIIARNQVLLFQFSEHLQDKQAALVGTDGSKQYQSVFADNINELFSKHEADNANHFRIAVIKADLDGIGALFEGIKEYDIYHTVSEILSDMIGLDFLSRKTSEFNEKRSNFKLYPLYIAGDDIFFAVPVAYLTDGVQLCKEILESINTRIKNFNELLPSLSMSIGIEFSFNREPIRYYNERVQQQLETAKMAPALPTANGKQPGSCIKICINGFVFYDSKELTNANKEAEVNFPNWQHFVSDVKRLKQMMQMGFAAHHFLYGLLEKITDPHIKSSKLKYSNAVLYHLLPQCVAGSTAQERENELILLGVLMSQLFVKKFRENRKGELEYKKEISIEPQQQQRLEGYVRLLLAFSDPRFNESNTSQTHDNSRTDFATNHKARLRGTLFNKPLRFLYEQSLVTFLVESGASMKTYQAKDLRALFVEEESYLHPNKAQSAKKAVSGKDTVKIYRTLKLSSSMLHRIKRLHKNKSMSIHKIAEMIETLNSSSKEEIAELELLHKQEGKAPPRLYFNKEKFKRIVMQSRLWRSNHLDDYLDALLIFYRLKELSIQYKLLYPKHKPSNENNNPFKHKNSHQVNKNIGQKGAKK